MNTRKLLFFLLSFSATVQGQDLTGIWRGHFRSNQEYERLMGIDDRYKMEVQIAQKDNTFHAVTYSYKSYFFYGKADADGNEDPSTNKIRLRESKIVELKTVGGDDACIMNCQLTYSKLGDEEFMEGTYTSADVHSSKDCGGGTIFLHKVAVSDFYEEPFLLHREKEIENEKSKTGGHSSLPLKKNNGIASTPDKIVTNKKPVPSTIHPKPLGIPKKQVDSMAHASSLRPKIPTNITKSSSNTKATVHHPPAKASIPQHDLVKTQISASPIGVGKNDSMASIAKDPIEVPIPLVLMRRANELVKTITVHTGDVELNIYDDGVIDNDTVSVYFDKKLIVSNERLSDKPIVVKLHFDQTSASHELVMVAENEGDIPPNTSLMIVKAGDDQYEVRIVSTEQKNAVVIFKYRKLEQ